MNFKKLAKIARFKRQATKKNTIYKNKLKNSANLKFIKNDTNLKASKNSANFKQAHKCEFSSPKSVCCKNISKIRYNLP